MKNKQLFYILRLARSKNLGPVIFNKLLFEHGSAKRIVENIDKYPNINFL